MMATTRRSLRHAEKAQARAEQALAVDVATTQEGQKPTSKAPSKSQKQKKKAGAGIAINATEATLKEKAIRLAEIEDELEQRAEETKATHPRRRVNPKVMPRVQESEEGAREELLHRVIYEYAPGTSENSGSGVLNSSRKSPSSQYADLVDRGSEVGQTTRKPPYEESEHVKDMPVDTNDIEENDTDSESENVGVGELAVPPVKTPGKNLNKAVERKHKTKTLDFRMQVQLNRQIKPIGSKTLPVSVDDTLFDTPGTKKHITNSVQTWAQGLPPPPAQKRKVSALHSATSTTTSNDLQVLRPSKSIKSCTTVVESNSDLPPPPRRSQLQRALAGKRRLAEELASDSDAFSDTTPSSPQPQRCGTRAREASSDVEFDLPCPSQKHNTKAGRTFKRTLPLPTQKKNHTGTSNHIGYARSQTRKPPTHGKKNRANSELVPDSGSESSCPPNYKPRARSHPSNRRRVEQSGSEMEEATLPSTLYGGLEDEDDTAEREAAVASTVPPRTAARRSKASIRIESNVAKPPRSSSNSNLPPGALDQNRWSGYFIPTFLKYLGGMLKEIWVLNEKETMAALQLIWNRVYSGAKPVGGEKVVHVVDYNVYSVVNQRAAEWRNSIGSTALVVVNDFFDSQKLFTTEARQQAAADLLFCERYAYYRTRDIFENGVKTIKKNGRYRGPLVIYTIAQHLIDVENSICVPGLIEDHDYPKAAIALSAVAVHRALELWAKEYITYESYFEAKTNNLKTGGIVKVIGPDGRVKKTTNFGRKQCERWSNQHVNDVWLVDDGKMNAIMADARKAVDVILTRDSAPRQKPSTTDGFVPRKICIESDSEDFW